MQPSINATEEELQLTDFSGRDFGDSINAIRITINKKIGNINFEEDAG